MVTLQEVNQASEENRREEQWVCCKIRQVSVWQEPFSHDGPISVFLSTIGRGYSEKHNPVR